MEQTTPLSRDLVFIGGGHTHALVLHDWAMTPLAGVRVTVINPEPVAAYSGMLPGYIAGHYTRDALDIDLVRLCRRAGARLILGKAEAIDRSAKQITVPGRAPIGYDVASIDVGITSTLTDLPGFAEHGLPAKPLSRFARAWAAYRQGRDPAQIVVLGAGVAGAEVAMAMVHALRADGREHHVTLIDRGRAFAALPTRAAATLRRAVQDHGVRLIEGTTPARVTAEAVELDSGEEVAANLVVGAAGSNPYPWLQATGLTDAHGFLPVDPYLRTADTDLYAVGDCATLPDPRPKSGVYAVRQAPFLFANLRYALGRAGTRKPYRPQKDYLKLISLGRKTALGEKWGMSVTADRLWKLKDDIDEKFMSKLNQPVPAMVPARPAPKALGAEMPMLCGGCGSKLGQGALQAALGPGGAHDDAAILPGGQVISTDHLRAFVDDPALMARIALTHAMGDIWAMGARPQAALASLILPRQTPAMAERAAGELMTAAREAAAQIGVEIVGGHTTQGAELTIGFTVTGVAERPITLAGAQPGDDLVLTKPIGSGTLMAAAMQGRARGWDVAAAWEAMCQDQGEASRILSGAHAMTDVTGFGLLGHLRAMMEASGTGATVNLASVPLLPGALELAQAGIRSSLYAENAGADAPDDPRHALLFDPQTSGGLLAAVPDGAAVIEALKAAGYEAALIGRVMNEPGSITIT
ncbi:MAG: selenide, water dikinase SelD [Pseudomonadota bacterium]